MVLLICESHLEGEECFLLLKAYKTAGEKKTILLRMLCVLTVISNFVPHRVSVSFSDDTHPMN